METVAAPNLVTIEGLWRSSTKRRPGSMSGFLRALGIEEPEPYEVPSHDSEQPTLVF